MFLLLACTIKAPEPGPNDNDNTAPVASILLVPEVLTAGVDIVAATSVEDPDGDGIIWDYTWTVDGDVVQEGIQNWLAAGTAIKGEAVEVTAVAWDGIDESEPVSAGGVLVNAVPEVTSVVIDPADPVEGEALDSGVEGWDADGDVLDWDIQWLADGQDAGTEVPEDATLAGETWVCIAIANDGSADSWPAETYVVIQ